LLVVSPFLIFSAQAEEPSLTDILIELGFTNTEYRQYVETFSAGTYNITLYAEFAGYHDENELSYYELDDPNVFNVIFTGLEGDGDGGYVIPPINKSFTADYEFGFSMLSPGYRYYTERSRNPDGLRHAKVYENMDDPGMYIIGFENWYGWGGDRDYNDMVFSLKPYTPPVNTPPSISGLPNLELDEDGSLDNAIDLWNYASDAETPDENLIFTILSVTEPDVGVTIDSNRYIDVQPTANWYGTSEVIIEVSDGELTDTDNFTITVNPINDSPVAYNQSVTTDEDTPKNITLTAYDVDGDTLTYYVVTPPSHGILSGTPPNLIYTPDSDYFGLDSFTFKAYDGQAYSNVATVSITVNPENDPPVVSDIPDVTFPEDGSDSSIDLDDYVSDVDNTDAEMTWTFTGNVNMIVSIDPVTHVVTFTAPANWFGQETITFRATDPGDLWDEDATTVTVTSVNDPPIASNLVISPPNPFTEDDLVGSYTYYDLESDPESGTEIRWYKDGILQPAYNDTLTIPSSATAKSETWYFTVRPKDGMDFGDLQTSSTVVIGNTPPVASNLQISPSSPKTTDNLVANYDYYDADSDPESGSEIRWYKDSVLQSAYNDQLTVPSSATANGQTWYFTVRPKDGTDFGTLQTSTLVTIGNTPPEASNLEVSPSSPYTTDDLVGNYTYYDADGDPESGSEIRWYKDDVVQSSFNDLLTVPSSATAKGQVWYFTVKPKDGTSFGTLQTSPSVTIQNSPPTAPVVDVTPDFPFTTDDLNCTVVVPSTDPDGDTVSYTYEWYKNDVLQTSLTTTTTALSVVIDSSNTNKGEVWKCVVTPHGSDGPPDEDEVTIQNSPPSISGVNITPDPAYTDDTLTATPYGWSDADGDAAQYVYQWQKWNGVSWQNISGETSNTLSSSNFVKGDQIKVICTPFDGEDYGVPKEDTITISNSPPSAPVVDVTPDSPVTTDDLTCTVASPSTDPDSDTITYTYEWYKDGSLQSGLTTITTALSVTIDSSNTNEGEVWKCVVTPNDGVEDGLTDQDEVTIGTTPNSPPVLDSIGDKTIDEENLLFFTAMASDPDVPPQTLTFSLGLGAPSGASITSGGDFTWTPTEAQGPSVYNINITVSDGIAIDYEVIQVTVNEVNIAPVLFPIGAKTVSEGALLQFIVTASDSDLPAQTLIYSASNLPPGATFNPGTHVFSWTPASGQAGVYSGVHFEVSDGYLTDSENITITVTSGAPPPPAVGGSALPITLDLATSNSLFPQIGLASALSVAVTATIILVRRRKKTSKRKH
jgi:hypothetical protein